MIKFLETCTKIQSKGKGNYSINTIMTYREYFLKYRFYIEQGNSKMQSYQNTGDDCGACIRTVIDAVKLFEG